MQNRAPGALVCWQRGQAVSGPGCGATTGGGIHVTFTGWPHPGTGIPSAAAIARRLDGVELPHPARHEEALDEAQDRTECRVQKKQQ